MSSLSQILANIILKLQKWQTDAIKQPALTLAVSYVLVKEDGNQKDHKAIVNPRKNDTVGVAS